MLFAVDVQYTGSIEHAQTSPASLTEQPSCPVCLGMLVSFFWGLRNSRYLKLLME